MVSARRASAAAGRLPPRPLSRQAHPDRSPPLLRYSFNGGSAYKANYQAASALLNTHISASCGSLTAVPLPSLTYPNLP